MLSKNPSEAYAIQNTNFTLAVKPMFKTGNIEKGYAPGKIHWKSKIIVSLLERGKSSVTACIDFPKSWHGMVRKFEAALMAESMLKLLGKVSAGAKAEKSSVSKSSDDIIFTVAMTGKYRGKTAADVANEESTDQVNSHIAFLEKNKDKYKANQLQIDALNKALELKEAGKLTVTPSSETPKENTRQISEENTILLYSSVKGSTKNPHPKIKNVFKSNSMIIQYKLGWDNPVEIIISNFYAPIKVFTNGGQNVRSSEAIEKRTLSFHVSIDDFSAIIEMINERLTVFLNNRSEKIEKGMTDVELANTNAYRTAVGKEPLNHLSDYEEDNYEEESTEEIEGYVEEAKEEETVEQNPAFPEHNFNGTVRTAGKSMENDKFVMLPVIADNESLILLFEKENQPKWLGPVLKKAANGSFTSLTIKGTRKEQYILYKGMGASA